MFIVALRSATRVLLHASGALLLGGLLSLIPDQAHAESASDWQWRGTLYGWLPDLGGATRYPTGGDGPDLEVDAETLVDNLNFTAMVALDAQKGQWGWFTDVLYMDLGNNESEVRDFAVGPQQIPGSVTLSTRFDLKAWVWTIAGTYHLFPEGPSSHALLFGARMVDVEESLGWEFFGDIGGLPVPGRTGEATVEATNWDAVAGIKGHGPLAGSRWNYVYHADVGTGDSDLTWQLMGGMAYAFDWGAATLSWRYLEYDLGNQAGIVEMDFNGPMLGVSFSW